MRNEENVMEKDRYHHPGIILCLILPHNECGFNFKSEIEEKVQTEMSRPQEYYEPSLVQFVETNDFHNQNIYEGDSGTDIVSVKCLPTYSNIKREFDVEVKIESDSCQEYNKAYQEQYMEVNKGYFLDTNVADGEKNVPIKWSPAYCKIEDEENSSVKHEENIKIEAYSYQVGESFGEPQEKKVVDSNLRQILKNNDGTESVPVEYVQVEMEDEPNFKMEFVKIEIDSYQEGSEETLEEQITEAEEEIDNTVIERIQETERKFKRTVSDQIKETFTFKTSQHSMDSFHNFRHGDEKAPLFDCSICHKQNSDAAKLKRHMFLHLKEAEYTHELISVEVCDKLGLKSKILAKIKGKEYHLDIFRCGECEYIASTAFHLRHHIKKKHLNATVNNIFKADAISVELKGDKFACQSCEYETYCSSDLDKHVSCKHLNERKFHCNLCEYITNQKSHLDSHLSSVHLKEKKFQCYVCEYKTNKKSHLDSHLSSVHLNERKFECNLCEYKSNRKSDLAKHVDCIHSKERFVHLQERKYECHLCDYKASKKSNLDSHLSSVHLKERKFQCQVCEYKASQKSDLTRHVNGVHSNERNFECDLCEYKAKHKSNLSMHLRSVHLKERKFECNLCEYKTSRKSDLFRHMDGKHLKERMFQCHSCEYKANSQSDLKGHLSSVH